MDIQACSCAHTYPFPYQTTHYPSFSNHTIQYAVKNDLPKHEIILRLSEFEIHQLAIDNLAKEMAFMLSVMIGVMQIVGSVLKMGFLVSFLGHPATPLLVCAEMELP